MQNIKITNANNNNLKNISLELKLNQWIAFIGKSGSGKSTLAADVIFGKYISKSQDVYVPIETALFRQKVYIPDSTQTIASYIGCRIPSTNKSLNDILQEHSSNQTIISLQLLKFVLKVLEIDTLQSNITINTLSLITFNKIRFVKFLIETTAKLLIIDELASGMSFAEAQKTAFALRELVNNGYSVITIEHSIPMIEASDYIVEIGPGAGNEGGNITFTGSTSEFIKTAHYKSIKASLCLLLVRNKVERRLLKIENINFNNLHLSEFVMPTNCIVNICGASGSGKTSMLDIVFRAFDKSTDAWKNRGGIDGEVRGKGYIRRPHFVDQTPIGNSSMSTPATYTKIMDIIRDLFSQQTESKLRKYTVTQFSYNSDGGCIECRGKGVKEISVDDEVIFERCSACGGNRYRDEINSIEIDGLSIGAMLNVPCGTLIKKCPNRKTLVDKIGFIVDVGLSYLTLGQPSPSLSGGESQRIKITKELAKKLSDRSLFILDTPSRGLHVNDLKSIFIMMRKLVDKNNSMLIADNNPFFIRNSDWVIYLNEGRVMYQGLPSKMPKEYLAQLGLGGIK